MGEHPEAVGYEAAEAALTAALAKARAEGAASERAAVVAFLRAQAEAGGDPWMSHVAYEVEAGLHQVVSKQD